MALRDNLEISGSRSPDYAAWRAAVDTSDRCVYLPEDDRKICWFQPPGDAPRYPTFHSELLAYDTIALYSTSSTNLPHPIRFAIIGRIPPRAFQLDADPNCTNLHEFPAGKGSAEVEDLEPENAHSEFKRGWNKLASIASAALPGFKEFHQAFGVFAVHNALPVLKVRHNFFKVRRSILCARIRASNSYIQLRSEVSLSDHRQSLDSEIRDDPAFSIEKWPSSCVAAKRFLVNNMSSYWAEPLRAYNWDKRVIYPSDYRKILMGATVWMEFSMEHTGVHNGEDVFDAFIRRVRVLDPPVSSKPSTVDILKAEDDGDYA